MTLHILFNDEGIPGWIGPEPREGTESVEGLTVEFLAVEFLADHRRLFSGEWVPRDPPEPPAQNPAMEAARRAADEAAAAAEAKLAADRAAKLEGILFEGVRCSATSADQSGLLAVLTAVQLQKLDFQPTRFEFENGSALVIHLSNYAAFMTVWLPFRQSFFRVT